MDIPNFCSKCGSQNIADNGTCRDCIKKQKESKYCKTCGFTDLTEDGKCRACIEMTYRYCAKCGSEELRNIADRFCITCDKKLKVKCILCENDIYEGYDHNTFCDDCGDNFCYICSRRVQALIPQCKKDCGDLKCPKCVAQEAI